ncbi:MAG: hypothetical protein IJ542_00495 [Clostridia bacterium]|nr:hypothetical protein [Clostridia bacterium]
MRKKYILFDESKVNTEMLEYLNNRYVEYLNILYELWDGGTVEQNDEKLQLFYESVRTDLDKFNPNDVVYLFEFIHNRKHYYRELLLTKNKRYNTTSDENVFDDKYKDQAIRDKEQYAEFASKDSILTKSMPAHLLDEARTKYRDDIKKLLGHDPWQERENF